MLVFFMKKGLFSYSNGARIASKFLSSVAIEEESWFSSDLG